MMLKLLSRLRSRQHVSDPPALSPSPAPPSSRQSELSTAPTEPARPSSPCQVQTSNALDEPTALPPLFMKLPPEIRVLIYEHYFLAVKEEGAHSPVGIDQRKLWRNHVHSFSGMHIAYPPLLHANRTIRHEAAKSFFAVMTFAMLFPPSPHTCCGKMWPGECLREPYRPWQYFVGGQGYQHEQRCFFPSKEALVREMLLSEPIPLGPMSLIQSVFLNAETLCPKVFSILGRCCPALKSLTLGVGKRPEIDFSQTPSPGHQFHFPRLQYYSLTISSGLVYLPGLTYLGFHVAEWCLLYVRPTIDLSHVYHFLQQLCEYIWERHCAAGSGDWNELSCHVVPVLVKPPIINVNRVMKVLEGGTTYPSSLYRRQAIHDPIDYPPDSDHWSQ